MYSTIISAITIAAICIFYARNINLLLKYKGLDVWIIFINIIMFVAVVCYDIKFLNWFFEVFAIDFYGFISLCFIIHLLFSDNAASRLGFILDAFKDALIHFVLICINISTIHYYIGYDKFDFRFPDINIFHIYGLLIYHDFTFYAQHWFQHKFNFYHEIHDDIKVLNVFSAFTANIFEIQCSLFFANIPLLMPAFRTTNYTLFSVISIIHVIYSHNSFNKYDINLNYVLLLTNKQHLLHHSKVQYNLATKTIVWDKLFSTIRF